MKKVKRALLFQLLGLATALAAAVWTARHYPVLAWVTRAQQTLASIHPWGAVLYPLLYAACNLLLLPAGVLALGSGLFFGLWWGFALNLAGNIVGAGVAFALSRLLGRGWIRQRFLRHKKWAALDEAIGREGWKIILLTQIHPLAPSSLLNYLYGITRIRFGVCLLWVAIGQAPGLFLYAYLGTLAQLGIRLIRGQTHPLPREYIVWIGGLLLTAAVITALGRLALRLLAEAEAKAGGAAPTVRPSQEPRLVGEKSSEP